MSTLEVNEEPGICSFKIPLNKILTNYKEKKSHFKVKKLSSYHLIQVIKVNISRNGTNKNHVPPDRMQLREPSIACGHSCQRCVIWILSQGNVKETQIKEHSTN